MLVSMRRRLAWAVIGGMSAVAMAVVYTFWVNPQINGPLGLGRFNEEVVRARVLATAGSLLEHSEGISVRLSQNTDRSSLRRMQQLFGLRAANYWAERKVPIQRWEYKIYSKGEALSNLALFQQPKPILEAEVSSSGRILALTIPPRGKSAPSKLSPDQALSRAEKLLRLLGVDVGTLTLTSTVSGERKGKQTFDFEWKQPIGKMPGLVNKFSVRLQAGYLTSFKRTYLFAETQQPSIWDGVIYPILFGATWLFLALVFIFLLVQKLHRDEVDFKHAVWFGVLAGVLTLVHSASNFGRNILGSLVAAMVLSLASALFFGLLWAVCESLLRRRFDEKLRSVDLVFQRVWNIRDTGYGLLVAGSAGLMLLALPVAIFVLAEKWPLLPIIFLPIKLSFNNLGFPGILLGNVLLGPIPEVFLVGTVFLGGVFPLLRIRFSRSTSAVLFSLVFALAVVHTLSIGPPLIAFAVALAVGAVLFFTMESFGWLAGVFALYLPLAVMRTALLLTARGQSILMQGWLSLALILALLFALAYAALFGRSISNVESYEPEYILRVRERERFARELEIAKGVQEKFLPKEYPVIPGFFLATRCIPAMEVGGDYFDFLPLPGGKWLLLLGDVSGKGVKAAFYMTLTKGILHAVSSEAVDHKEIFRRLNNVFRQQSEPGVFLTLCAAILDPAKSEVEIISAGHNPPILLRNGHPEMLSPKGLVLGVMDDDFFLKSLHEISMDLAEGDCLILYTDGVSEAMNKKREEYGMERFGAVLERVGQGTEKEVLEAILTDVAGFQAGGPQADDITLMVLRAGLRGGTG